MMFGLFSSLLKISLEPQGFYFFKNSIFFLCFMCLSSCLFCSFPWWHRVACEGTAPSPRIGHSFNRDPRNHFSSTSSSSHHRFFVFGGFDGLRYCNDMFQLDVWINKQDQTTSNFWESIGIDSISCKWSEVSMKSDSTGLITWPDARAYFDSATFENAREREGASLLISGGSNSRGVFHSMFKFDLDQYLWKRVPLCTTPNAQPLSFSKTKYLEERQSHKMEVLGSFRLYHSEECTNDGSFFTSTFDGSFFQFLCLFSGTFRNLFAECSSHM